MVVACVEMGGIESGEFLEDCMEQGGEARGEHRTSDAPILMPSCEANEEPRTPTPGAPAIFLGGIDFTVCLTSPIRSVFLPIRSVFAAKIGLFKCGGH